MHAVLLPVDVALFGNQASGNSGRTLLHLVQDWRIIDRSADALRALFAIARFGDVLVDLRLGGSGLQMFARCTRTG